MENTTTIGFSRELANNEPWVVAIGVFFIVQGTLGNILIIVAVALDSTLRSHTDGFIMNAALMDVLVTGVFEPANIPSYIQNRNIYPDRVCQVSTELFEFIFPSCSVCPLLLYTVGLIVL